MKRISGVFLWGFLLLWMTPALGQFHDGWNFKGSTRADAEARISGINRTALIVNCNGNAPRVIVIFRDAIMPLNAVTTRSPVKVTFDFLKRGVTSWITSYFDKESVQNVIGEQFAYGTRNEPATVEHVNFSGTDASTVLTQLKSMDSVSVGADELGQPASFSLDGAGPMIDRVLAICSSGPS